LFYVLRVKEGNIAGAQCAEPGSCPAGDNAGMTFVRFLMLLSLVVWVGGIIFFAFVVAPALFSVLPTRQLAGSVVTRCLGALHWIGVGCGVTFLIFSLIEAHGRLASLRNGLIVGMLALTLVSQIVVGGKMQRLRADMGDIDSVAVSDVRRVEFNALHQWSTRLEVMVLLLGLVAIYTMARQMNVPSPQAGAASAKARPDARAVSPG
jgi:Domain of unknown function (DUF4149)